jgi:AcrR family transcriptional regulator
LFNRPNEPTICPQVSTLPEAQEVRPARSLRNSQAKGRIVRSAVALFSRQGYRGTSSRDIARLADVSEVTVYRYFQHKEDIFWSALDASFDDIAPRLRSIGATWEGRSLSVVLPQIMTLLVDLVAYSPHTVRLVAVALLELGVKARDICHMHLEPLFSPICTYLAASLDTDQPRSLDPAVVTAIIILAVLVQPEVDKLAKTSTSARKSDRKTVESYSDFWLYLLEPLSRQ